jgi:hypothetical protein
MITAGFTIHSPITESHTTILKTDTETDGMGWLLEVRCAPGQKSDIAEHYHLDWVETFEIISGTASYKLDGVQKTAEAGETFVVQARQLHIHPWCAGDEEMVYRQSNRFGQRNPAAVQDVLGTFATIAGLAGRGKIAANGLPKNPLQLAATLRTLTRHGGYDASLPASAQNFIAATLGRLAESLGYRAVYPQFIGE